jgi:hypothetical protein
MCEFKVGDRVRVKSGQDIRYDAGSEHIVTRIERGYVYVDPHGRGKGLGYYPNRFELVKTDPICEAKALLEKEGYVVVPPPVKMTGRVSIRRNKEHGSIAIVEYQPYFIDTFWETIAIVDWEEGQGLTRTTEGDGLHLKDIVRTEDC